MKKATRQRVTNSKLIRHIHVLYLLSIALLVGMVVIVIVLVRPRSDESVGVLAMRSDIQATVDSIYQPAAIDPKEQKQYIYEANVRFPMEPNGNLRYAYGKPGPGDADKEQIYLTVGQSYRLGAQALYAGDVKQLLEKMPIFQACAREFIVQFQDGLDGYDSYAKVQTVPLADGRQAFIFKNGICESYLKTQLPGATDAHLQLLSRIESY